jgi:hypothetical protein
MARPAVSVQRSAIRLVPVAGVVSELHPPRGFNLSPAGHKVGMLPRRFPRAGRVKVGGRGSYTVLAPPASPFRVHSEHGEDPDISVPGTRILGDDDQLQIADVVGAIGEAQTLSQAREEDAPESTSRPDRHGCGPPIHGGETPILLSMHSDMSPTHEWSDCLSEQGAGSSDGSDPLGSSPPGLDVLDEFFPTLERQGNAPLHPEIPLHDGCRPIGMGRLHHPERATDGDPRPVRPTVEAGFNQREGTPSDTLLPTSIRSSVQVVPVQDSGHHRLDDSSDLHQQDGRTSPILGRGDDQDSRVCPETRHPPTSGLHFDAGQQDCRPSVEGIRKPSNRM